MGFWSTMGIIIWGFCMSLGVLFSAMVFGLPGVIGWVGVNLFLAYRLSRARGHWRSDAFDDKLTAQRMHDAEEELVKSWKKK